MSSRSIGLGLILLSAAVLAAAVPSFVSRARAFNAARESAGGMPHLKKIPMSLRHFKAHGREASIIDSKTPDGRSAVTLTYGDKSEVVPVHTPPAKDAPELLIYGEWLVMLRIIPVQTDGSPNPGATEADDRYFLVVRETAEGFDPDSWGSVRRKEWSFRFYELRNDGTIAASRYRWPLPSARPNVEVAKAELKGDAEAMRKAREEAETKRLARLPEEIRALPELQERTIEYDAALYVIPKLSVPSYRFKDTAFNWSVAGWTMPAAGFAVLGLSAGLCLVFAPRQRASVPTEPRA